MKQIFIVILAFALLAGCSVPQATAPAPTLEETHFSTPEPATAISTVQPIPSKTPSPLPFEAPSATPSLRPTLAPDEWKILPVVPAVSENARAIYQRGLAMGNDPLHFSKVGDCQNVASYFLSTFDKHGSYTLGEQYEYLQPTIEHFQGSWSRESLAVKGGFNVAAVLSPLRSNPDYCNKDESPLACELRVWKPSVVFVSMETWWGKKPAEDYEKYMRQVLDYIISQGAVPVLATKADNLEGDHKINAVIAKLAWEYDIPLWNFWAAVQPLPGQGLSEDKFHLTYAWNVFDDPVRMEKAWPVRNLTALQALNAVYNAVK